MKALPDLIDAVASLADADASVGKDEAQGRLRSLFAGLESADISETLRWEITTDAERLVENHVSLLDHDHFTPRFRDAKPPPTWSFKFHAREEAAAQLRLRAGRVASRCVPEPVPPRSAPRSWCPPAALGESSPSSYSDLMILKDDLTQDWHAERTAEAFDRRVYSCQNWRADVVALVDEDGVLLERAWYDPYGTPNGLPASTTAPDTISAGRN